jgi:hypothetical protein
LPLETFLEHVTYLEETLDAGSTSRCVDPGASFGLTDVVMLTVRSLRGGLARLVRSGRLRLSPSFDRDIGRLVRQLASAHENANDRDRLLEPFGCLEDRDSRRRDKLLTDRRLDD